MTSHAPGPCDDASDSAARAGGSGLFRVAGLQALAVVLGLGAFALVSVLPGALRWAQGPALVLLFGAFHVWLARRPQNRAAGEGASRALGSRVAAAAGLAVLGALLAVVPLGWAGRLGDGVDVGAGTASLTVPSVLGTLCAVAWEELWFRNPLVQRVRRAAAVCAFALWNGALFAAVHLLNPAFDPLDEGPELILAGALLTVVCNMSGTVVAPLILHFAFNLTSTTARASVSPGVAATLDGADVSFRRCLLLAVACVPFVIALRRRERSRG